MADTLTKKARSFLMSKIRSRDTQPEKRVRFCAHLLGYRYRLHDAKLPGKPDLVFKKLRLVVFVNGCFWHFHKRCRRNRLPKVNREYWKAKFEENAARDARVKRRLRRLGWSVKVIWECQTKDSLNLSKRVIKLLESQKFLLLPKIGTKASNKLL